MIVRKSRFIGALLKSLITCLAFYFASTAAAQVDSVKNLTLLASPSPSKDSSTPYLLEDGNSFWMTWQETGRVKISQYVSGKWSPAVTAAESPRLMTNWADFPSLQKDGRGYLYLHWLETPETEGAHGYFINIAKSSDRGKNWKKLGRLHRDQNPHAEHGFVSMVPMKQGVRAFWLDGGGMKNHQDAMQLRTAVITEKIENESLIDEKVCSCCGTAAVVIQSTPAVFYRDRSDKEIRDISLARWVQNKWEKAGISDDGWEIHGCPVNGPDADSDGKIVAMAWYSGGGKRSGVYLSFSANQGKTFGKPVAVDDFLQGSLGRVQTILLDANQALVFWMKSKTDGKADLYARRIHRDGRRGLPVLVAETQSSRAVGFPQALKIDNEIFMAWTEEGLKTIGFPVSEIPAVGKKDIPLAKKASGFSPGEYVPHFAAKDTTGKDVDLSQFKGKTILLNFWASWCDACIEEFGMINDLEKKYAAKGLKIVLVNIDENEDWPKAKQLIEQAKLQPTVWRNTADRTTALFGYSALPYTVILDKELKLSAAYTGSLLGKKEVLEKQLVHLLR